MKRAIRRRCGFGCVVCGLPLYEYDHMLGFAEVQRHEENEITLLCDQHHKERTNGLLPRDVIERANAAPFNLRAGVSKRYDLHFAGNECEAIIGSNRFTTRDQGYGTEMIPIIVDYIPLIVFRFGDGHLLLNLRLFDQFNNVILRIDDNALTYRTDTWDIQLVARNLILREAERQILIDMEFEPPNRILINRGRLLCNGVTMDISPEAVTLHGIGRIYNNVAIGCPAGLIIGPNDPRLRGFLSAPNVPRYPDSPVQASRPDA